MSRVSVFVLVLLIKVGLNLGRHVAYKSENQYYQLNPLKDSYHFGYEVNPDGNFHHERRGQDGVTYGCYGYLDSNGRPHVTYYVADRKGYRLVEPNKPVQIYLSGVRKATEHEEDDVEDSFRSESRPWQALFLPKGCGRHSGVGSSTAGPELIYKPPGAISTTVKSTISTTKYTTKPMTTTKRPQPTTGSTTTKKPTPAYGCTIYPTATPSGMGSTGSSSQATPRPSAKPSTTTVHTITQNSPLVDVDVDLNLGNSKLSSDEANSTDSTRLHSTRHHYYFVPYQYPPPPGVPSTSCSYCPSNYGYIGLAPAIFVPINSAKQLGLTENFSVEPGNNIPLRTFARHDNGSWALQDIFGYEGQPLVLEYSKALESILNSDNFNFSKENGNESS